MAGAAMNKNAITLILALSLGLSACGSSNDQVPLSQAPLAGAAIGGPFTLTDQDGKQRSYSEFDGKYRIVYFGYQLPRYLHTRLAAFDGGAEPI